MTLLTAYWDGNTRVYHHTPPINMFYALYQAVNNVLEEGPENAYARHMRAHKYLIEKVGELGWDMLVEEKYRLPMLNALVVPEGVNEADLRKRLLNDYHIEVSSGLGSLAGKIIRIGLMGYNAEEYNVDRVVNAMKEILAK